MTLARHQTEGRHVADLDDTTRRARLRDVRPGATV